MSENVLRTEKLYKSYKLGDEEIPVLKDINLSVKKGELISIMGPSGSGKSTLLNILGCLDTPTSGKYLFNNMAVDKLSQKRLAGIRNSEIGFVFQNFNLLPKLSVFSNVELPLIYGNIAKPSRRSMVEATLKKLGLWERKDHKPNEISGGQKQRTAIARALVKNPAIIFADEPTGNLDSTTTGEILALLKDLHAEGNTILIITHEKEVAEESERIFYLLDGSISDTP